MYKVLVIGAGSIGNHLTHACRTRGWAVDLYDVDPEALVRTQTEIYPARYGAWDDSIQLLTDNHFASAYDVAIIGTPPDTHLEVATELLKQVRLRYLLLEKPLCSPSLQGLEAFRSVLKKTECETLIGYNHIFTSNTVRAEQLIREFDFGQPLSIHVRWVEHWGGIFAAHPWLAGPADSYLGHWSRGGGACGEHSHAISLWQFFSETLGMGSIKTVTASMRLVEEVGVEYDETAQILVESDGGLVGSIIQDVVTAPAEKVMRIQFSSGFLEWRANIDPSHDSVRYCHPDNGSEDRVEMIKKSRPDDFFGQTEHLQKLLSGEISIQDSPNTLEAGIHVMKAVSAAHVSNANGCSVQLSEIRERR